MNTSKNINKIHHKNHHKIHHKIHNNHKHINMDSNNKTDMVYHDQDQRLKINKHNTMIILDWDDTLYPTTWSVSNNIDLTNPKARYKYIRHFEKLDEKLNSLFNTMKRLGDIAIITNAMPEWIQLSLSVLPKTKTHMNNVAIISAREKYQNTSKMIYWKKNTFLEEMHKRSQNKVYTNILSLGDAEYEHIALLGLYNLKSIPHKYLKSIKFLKSNKYDMVLEQINVIDKNILKLCNLQRHLDLTFDEK